MPKPRQAKKLHDYVNLNSLRGELVASDGGSTRERKPVLRPAIKPKPTKRLLSPQVSSMSILEESLLKPRSYSEPVRSSVRDSTDQLPSASSGVGSAEGYGDNPVSQRQSNSAGNPSDDSSEQGTANSSILSGTPVLADSKTSGYSDKNTLAARQHVQNDSDNMSTENLFGTLSQTSRPTSHDYDNVTLSWAEDGGNGIYENISVSLKHSPYESTASPTSDYNMSFTNPTSDDNDIVMRRTDLRSHASEDTVSTDYDEEW